MADTEEVHECTAQFQPVVQLDPIELKALEEDEDQIFIAYARIYRYDQSVQPAEWKERGTGTVKLLQHRNNGKVRLLMRRIATFKICANHYIDPVHMRLKPMSYGSLHPGCCLTYHSPADLFEGEISPQTFAIRFTSCETAQEFKEAFEQHWDEEETSHGGDNRENGQTNQRQPEDPSTTEDSGRTTQDSGRTTEDSGRTTQDSCRTTEDGCRSTEDSATTTEDSATTTQELTREPNKEQLKHQASDESHLSKQLDSLNI